MGIGRIDYDQIYLAGFQQTYALDGSGVGNFDVRVWKFAMEAL